MVAAKVHTAVKKIVEQKSFPDEELMEDAELLNARLAEVYEEMSTFDEYRSEVISGKLEWSPVHRSERFWRENAVKLGDNKHALVKVLVQQLKASDPTVAAVAAHDLGEYARHYPRGKHAIDSLDGKPLIMMLLEVCIVGSQRWAAFFLGGGRVVKTQLTHSLPPLSLPSSTAGLHSTRIRKFATRHSLPCRNS